MHKMHETVVWDPASDAAVAILNGAVNRKREIFHPHHKVFPAILIYSIGKKNYVYIYYTMI